MVLILILLGAIWMKNKYGYDKTASGWYSIDEFGENEYDYGCDECATILAYVEMEDEAETIVNLLNSKDKMIHKLTRSIGKLLIVDAMASDVENPNENQKKEIIGKLKLKNSNEPSYYNCNGLSPLEAFKEGLLSKEEVIGFCKGNVIKYTVRAGKKDDALEDIDKAIDYLENLKEVL